MNKKIKKGGIALIILVIIALGFFILKKPAITGFAVVTKETAYSDELNLEVNESKEVAWFLKNPGDLKSIKLAGAISKNASAKVYIEKGNERYLIFDNTKQLFDVNVQVLPDYKSIAQGDELLIQIILFNLRGYGGANVSVKYSIKNSIGNLIATEEETVFVETQAKFARKLLIPSDLKSGNYITFVEVKTPEGIVGTSSDSFEVKAKYEIAHPEAKYYVLGVIILALLVFLTIFAMNLFRKLKRVEEVVKFKKEVPEEKTQKLEKELSSLENAYKSKLISEESYKKNKERIEKELGRLRKVKEEIPKEEYKKEKKETKEKPEPEKKKELAKEEKFSFFNKPRENFANKKEAPKEKGFRVSFKSGAEEKKKEEIKPEQKEKQNDTESEE